MLEEHLVKNIISKKPKFYWIYSKEKCIPFTINDLGSTHGSYKKLQDRMIIMVYLTKSKVSISIKV